MEQRKLIKLGNSSFAIALPKYWINKSGLKKGENIFLEENSNGEILLWPRSRKISNEKKTEISMADKDVSLIRKEIVTAYIKGSNSIILKGKKNKKEVNEIKDFVKVLLGFEVIESDNDKITAKDFFNIEETNLTSFIKRIDSNIKEMFSIVNLAIDTGTLSKKEFEEIEKIDADITRFYFVIARLFFMGLDNPPIINALKKNNLDFFSEWWLAYNLEMIGDKIKAAAKILHSAEIRKEDIKAISEVFNQIYALYNDSIYLFYKKDSRIARESAIKGKSIAAACQKLAQSKDVCTAKLAVILNEVENNLYQNLKIVMYGGN